MRLVNVTAIALGLALVVVSASMTSAQPDQNFTSRLSGFWEQTCQAQDGNPRTSSSSLFAIFDREWGIAFTQYADDACQQRVMTAVLRGTYAPTAPSKTLPGVTEMTFRFSRKSVVAYDSALLDRLNAGACGPRRWDAGVEQDVSSDGCLWIESLRACPQEFDLAKIDGEQLYLGMRPRPGTNICAEDRRPIALRPVPLRRR